MLTSENVFIDMSIGLILTLSQYAGNDAPPFQSGLYESKNRYISKRGSALLRKACYEIMQCLKMHQMTDDPVVIPADSSSFV